MLAQNFMTAEALGITDVELEALIKTLGFFERGEIPPDTFDMRDWCGTACCLSGWTEKLTGFRVAGLYRLFAPMGRAIYCTNPAKGAHALRNYLTTGEADWPSVMAEPA